MQIRNYVISLPTALKRREHIVQEFGKQGIPFEFFNALAPSSQLDAYIRRYMPKLTDAKLSQIEKACFISHLLLWYKCIDENLPYICIFEDDVLLGENAAAFLTEEHWLDERFGLHNKFLLHLETFLMPVKCELQYEVAPYDGRRFDILRSKHFGAAGYIISQHSIRIFLNILERFDENQLDSLDELLFNKFLANEGYIAYQLNPALCVQELQIKKSDTQLESQLEAERVAYRAAIVKPKPKKTLKYRLMRIKQNVYRALTKYKRKKSIEQVEPIVPFK